MTDKPTHSGNYRADKHMEAMIAEYGWDTVLCSMRFLAEDLPRSSLVWYSRARGSLAAARMAVSKCLLQQEVQQKRDSMT